MVKINNQEEFNTKYGKEIKEIEIKRNRNFKGELVIENYSELWKLSLREVKNIDKVTLKNLPQLQECTIWTCNTKELIIDNCPQIKTLNVRRNLLTSLEFLKDLGNLEELDIDGNNELIKMLEPYRKIIQKSNADVQTLEKEKQDLQQKYESLKNFLKEVLISLSKDNQEELVNELNSGIEAGEKKVPLTYSTEIRTTELTSKLKLSVEEMQELKGELKTKLDESEVKIQELEKQLAEAKSRAEERQKKVEELDNLSIQVPICEKITDFLKAKSLFLNARWETIEELQKCYNRWDRLGRKNAIFSEVGNTISNVGGSITGVVTFGIPKTVGETFKSSSNLFSKIVIDEKSNKEFQISLKNEKELEELNQVYASLISLTRDLRREDERKFIDLLDLRIIDGKEELFGKGKKYKVFGILSNDKIWREKHLSFEKMEVAIDLLLKNLNELETEGKEQINKVIDELKISRRYGDLVFKIRDAQEQIRRFKKHLNELIESAKDKLKSKSKLSDVKRQERDKELESFFKNLPTTSKEFIEKLENIKKDLSKKLTMEEINNLYQVQVDLTKLQMELEDLKSKQQEVQTVSPTSSTTQFNWENVEIPPKGNN